MRGIFCLLFWTLPFAVYGQADSLLIYDVVDFRHSDSLEMRFKRVTLFPDTALFVVVTAEKRSIAGGSGLPVPRQFLYKVKVDSTMKVASKVKDAPLPDSIWKVNHAALDSFYRYSPDIHIDTLVIADRKTADADDFQHTEIQSVCGYKKEIRSVATLPIKHGEAITYYSIPELKDVIIVGNFRLKSKGSWENGSKAGTWRYYSPQGYLQKVEKWKNGKLRKEKIFT